MTGCPVSIPIVLIDSGADVRIPDNKKFHTIKHGYVVLEG